MTGEQRHAAKDAIIVTDQFEVIFVAAAVARVAEEVKDMERIAKRDNLKLPFEPWDYLYYAEKVRKANYNLDQEELKPYFELNNMTAGAFYMAEQLYGLTFTEITLAALLFADAATVKLRDVEGDAVDGVDRAARSREHSFT